MVTAAADAAGTDQQYTHRPSLRSGVGHRSDEFRSDIQSETLVNAL